MVPGNDVRRTDRGAHALGLTGLAVVLVGALGTTAAGTGRDTAPVEALKASSFRGSGAPPTADTLRLATGPYARMQTLLEKTIFQVNVAELTLRYDSATADRIRRAVQGRAYSESRADSVAAAVLAAPRVEGRLEFRRNVGLGRFLNSLRGNMAAARDAGMLADTAFRRFRGRLSEWYSELRGRGVYEGDVTEYRIRGDTLRVLFRSRGGDTLIDRRDVGEQHRRAVLGGYLAPGADFREGLVRSLFRSREP